jgi:hypothetical protein
MDYKNVTLEFKNVKRCMSFCVLSAREFEASAFRLLVKHRGNDSLEPMGPTPTPVSEPCEEPERGALPAASGVIGQSAMSPVIGDITLQRAMKLLFAATVRRAHRPRLGVSPRAI